MLERLLWAKCSLTLGGLYYGEKFWKVNIWMRSMQCNVEFGYQLSIRTGTKENDGKPWSSWPVAGPSGCKLTTSQQSGIEYASPNIVSLSVRLLYYKIRIQFVLQMFYIHIIWISNIPCTTLKKMMDAIPNMNTRKKRVFIFILFQ
jgi:hypothetical protein